MELRAPRSESHHCAVVVRFRTNGRAIEGARARHGIGTNHLSTGDIEQDDVAREPVRVIHAKRAYGGAVA